MCSIPRWTFKISIRKEVKSTMFYKKKTYSLENFSIDAKSTEDILKCSSKSDYVDSTIDANEVKLPVKRNPFLGFIFAFIASINFSLTSVIVKKLSYIDPGLLSLFRNAGVFAATLPIAVYCVKEVFGPKKERGMLIARSFIGATALYLNLTAYRYLPLAETAVILSAIPPLTTLVARVYLKEPCGLMQSISLVITVTGVVISVRLPELLSGRDSERYDYEYLGGLAAAVACVITVSITLVTLRKMKDLHFSVTMMYAGFLGMLENAVINASTSSFAAPNCGWDQIMCILIGLLGFFGNCAFTLSVQVEATGVITTVRASLDIIVAIMFQIIFFNENPDMYNIIGACLVMVSMTIMGMRRWLLTVPEKSKARERFKCFLL